MLLKVLVKLQQVWPMGEMLMEWPSWATRGGRSTLWTWISSFMIAIIIIIAYSNNLMKIILLKIIMSNKRWQVNTVNIIIIIVHTNNLINIKLLMIITLSPTGFALESDPRGTRPCRGPAHTFHSGWKSLASLSAAAVWSSWSSSWSS